MFGSKSAPITLGGLMTNLKTFSLLLILQTAASVCIADILPPNGPNTEVDWKPLSKNRLSTGVNLGRLQVRFGKSTLSTILKSTGVGKIEQKGDAAEHVLWICYSVKASDGDELVWFESNGEMGGNEHEVTAVSARLSEPHEKTADCPTLPSKFLPISLTNGLWLGDTLDSALTKLGKPSHQSDLWWSFMYQGHRPGNCAPDGFDELNWVDFESRGKRLTTLLAGQVTSC